MKAAEFLAKSQRLSVKTDIEYDVIQDRAKSWSSGRVARLLLSVLIVLVLTSSTATVPSEGFVLTANKLRSSA
jgi:hypothetical protein